MVAQTKFWQPPKKLQDAQYLWLNFLGAPPKTKRAILLAKLKFTIIPLLARCASFPICVSALVLVLVPNLTSFCPLPDFGLFRVLLRGGLSRNLLCSMVLPWCNPPSTPPIKFTITPPIKFAAVGYIAKPNPTFFRVSKGFYNKKVQQNTSLPVPL